MSCPYSSYEFQFELAKCSAYITHLFTATEFQLLGFKYTFIPKSCLALGVHFFASHLWCSKYFFAKCDAETLVTLRDNVCDLDQFPKSMLDSFAAKKDIAWRDMLKEASNERNFESEVK